MKTVKWTDADSAESSLLQGQLEDTVVERDGHPVALIVPFDTAELEWYARERDPAFIESIARTGGRGCWTGYKP